MTKQQNGCAPSEDSDQTDQTLLVLTCRRSFDADFKYAKFPTQIYYWIQFLILKHFFQRFCFTLITIGIIKQ